MTNKNTEKKSIIYLKKFIYNLVHFVDEFFAALETYSSSLLSKEECEQALSALIEELEKYKMHLDQLVIDPEHPLNNLVKLKETDLLK
ncbi:hypothetical protein GR632_04020 [Chlamydia psittaci]|uniref:Uncharacterized protein n=1 Tax=Chlamydophila parapsittaci TaxID=344886 RepID=A0ABX5VY07_9CHLA|nr:MULTISPECIES: hypothetical protein [Chlamydia]QDE37453.1 hypothetical protein FI836_04040 [Chlamydophila parapsittaci]QHE19114.1 hypothetical protein GR632_04020 [Chlamydia psittaci]UOB75972.1 hypothetical protein MRE55_04060 [Chlamydia psittaci]